MPRFGTLLIAIVAVLAIPAAAQASTLTVAQGVLTYRDTTAGYTNAVALALSPDGTRITATENGRTNRSRPITITSDGSCTAAATTGSCAAAAVTSIIVDSGPADDAITQGTALPSRLIGGAGNDAIVGGPGSDVFPTDAGADTYSGGGGTDIVDYSTQTAPVAVSLDGVAGDGTAGENDNVGADVEQVIGGSGNDALTGNDSDNVLVGNAGGDTLAAGGGNDQLDGGAGNDALEGGVGDDLLGGGGDNDRLTGAVGNDQLDGGAGDDALDGGAGDDALTGGGDNDVLAGAAGNDQLDGGAGADTLSGGGGVDTATYATATTGVRVTLDRRPNDGAPGENDNVETENVVGSPAGDVLVGNTAANVLSGGAGSDRLLGGKGADTLNAGQGDDIVQSLDGVKDRVACGDGEDGVVSDRRDVRSGCDYIKYRTVAASSTAVHVRKGVVRVPVRCSPATAIGCHGRIALKVRSRTFGTRVYRLASGRRWVARIKLTSKGRAYVAQRRVTKASLVVRESDASGVAVRTTQTIRIGH